MSKLSKLIKAPHLFLRDFLNKRYPCVWNESGVDDASEAKVIEHEFKLERLFEPSFPIDVVYTWVDGNDPSWVAKYESVIGKKEKNSYSKLATDSARFSSHDELYWSVKSVQRYLPWVNKIYIVTDEQMPVGLENISNVQVINHKQIINDTYLPTFNSHVIEAHLHKIPDLSEHFIYFNDDVFVARELPAAHFFTSSGLASVFVSGKKISDMQAKGVSTPTLDASNNTIHCLNSKVSFKPNNSLVHTYLPLKKSVYQQAWKLFDSEIQAFLNNKTRSSNDLNLASMLIPWLTYASTEGVFKSDICHYFNIRSAAAKTHYRNLLSKKMSDACPHSFCANDFTSTKACQSNYQKNFSQFVKSYYQV